MNFNFELKLVYNINFEAAAFFFAAILYAYLRKKYYTSSFINKTFRRLVFCQLVTICLDIASAVMISNSKNVPDWANLIVTSLYFAAMGALFYTLHLFFISFGLKKKAGVFFLTLSRVVLILYLSLISVNIPTGIIFRFENGVYQKTELYFIFVVIPIVFLAECGMTFLLIRRRVSSKIFAVLTAHLFMSVLGPVLQYMFFPQILLANFFQLFSMILCLFALVSPDYAELAKKRAELFELQKHLELRAAQESEKIYKRDRQKELLFGQIIDALAATIDAGEKNRNRHSENVAELSKKIADKMFLLQKDVQKIYYTAILHDIGIIGVPEEIVTKQGKLTQEEFDQIKKHSEIGERILSKITEMPEMAQCVRSHHERFDGKGYPDGLAGEQIPLGARIIAVADAYDAMTHERCYKQVMSRQEAKTELRRMAGSQFDPEVVVAALDAIPD